MAPSGMGPDGPCLQPVLCLQKEASQGGDLFSLPETGENLAVKLSPDPHRDRPRPAAVFAVPDDDDLSSGLFEDCLMRDAEPPSQGDDDLHHVQVGLPIPGVPKAHLDKGFREEILLRTFCRRNGRSLGEPWFISQGGPLRPVLAASGPSYDLSRQHPVGSEQRKDPDLLPPLDQPGFRAEDPSPQGLPRALDRVQGRL